MACLLQPECNFLHGYFRCWIPVEIVDLEVKITSLQGMHIFRRDRAMQLIKCTPWNTRLCPNPTIIKKIEDLPRGRRKMGPILANIGPHNWTQILRSGRTTLWGRGRGQYQQKGSGLVQPKT